MSEGTDAIPTVDGSDHHRRRVVVACMIGAILLLAAGLRFWHLGTFCYWFDEAYSLVNASGQGERFANLAHEQVHAGLPRFTEMTPATSTARVWSGMQADMHPPLYFVSLLWWRQLFGDGAFAVRSLSVLCSVLSIIPIVLIFKKLGDQRGMIWAALVLATANVHIVMAQDARPYAMSVLLISVSYWLLVVWEFAPEKTTRAKRAVWYIAYTASLVGAALTHYFTALALAGQGIYALTRLRKGKLYRWLMCVAVAACLVGAAWGPQFARQVPRITSQTWLNASVATDVSHNTLTVLRALELPSRLLVVGSMLPIVSDVPVDSDQANPGGMELRPAIAGVLLLGAAVYFACRRRAGASWLFVCWYAMPITFLFVVDLLARREMLLYHRYAVVALPGLAGLVGIAAPQVRGRVGEALVGLMALAAIGLPAHVLAPKPQAATAAAMLDDALGPRDLIIHNGIGHPDYWPMTTYLLIAHYLPSTDRPVLLMRQPPDAKLTRQIATFDRFAVVGASIGRATNPAPHSHVQVAVSPYLLRIGHIYLYARKPLPPLAAPAPEE